MAFVIAPGVLAQDLAASLVGTWEGQVDQRGRTDPRRTLVITSAEKQDGTWKVAARFGVTGGNMGKVDVTVTEVDGRPTLSFTTGAGSNVTLTVLDSKSMQGTFHARGTSQRETNVPIRLEKKS